MIPLIDTHQHLIYRSQNGYDWADGVAALKERDFTLRDYTALAEGRGIAGTIFMEVDASDYKAEARHISALSRQAGSGILGVVASCRPEEPGFDAWLEECADLPVVGYRRILHEISDDLSRDPAFRRNVAQIGAQGRVFDMCFRADQLPIALELAKACPEMTLVLDHCGVPDIASDAQEPWRSDIRALAGLPNVMCKLSGVLAYCAPHRADQDAIRPYLEHVIDCFSPARCLWGSDWPVVNTTASLPDWIVAFRAVIADLSQDEQAMICNGTAQRVYGVTL